MKNIDYKFWYIKRDDDGIITEAGIRFFEGENKDVNEIDIEGNTQTVNRYVREKRLSVKDLKDLSSQATRKETSGDEAIVYTPEHFGKIKTAEELALFCNKELAKDKAHEPVEVQREVSDIKKVK